MDHRYIEDNNLIELYALGRLSTEEQVRFEEHFAECEDCLGQLELAGNLAESLRIAATEDIRAAWGVGLAAALGRWLRRPWAGAALACLLALIVLPLLFLAVENRRLTGDLERTRGPLTGGPSLLLTLARDAETGPPATLEAGHSGGWLPVAVEVAPDPRVAAYGARLRNAAGSLLWQARELEADRWDTLRLTFPAEMLPAGEYRLEVEAVAEDGRREPLGDFAFRVTAP